MVFILNTISLIENSLPNVFFETQKEQKLQKDFHKSSYIISRLICSKNKKNFCENPFVTFVPFVFQKQSYSNIFFHITFINNNTETQSNNFLTQT